MAQFAIQQAFDLALQHHGAGRLQEAEELYRKILDRQPQNADAMHLLGVLASQTGRNDLATELLRKVISLDPTSPEPHVNLGNVLKNQARLDDAIAAYKRAIVINPSLAVAYSNLGNALREKGQLDEAIAACQRAVVLRPDYADAHVNLGNAMKDSGQRDDAIAAYQQAIALDPNLPEAHCNLGSALRSKGQLDEAITAFRKAIVLKAGYAKAHMNLGNALKDKGQCDDAIAAYRRALALDPNLPEAHSNLVFTMLYHPGLDSRAITEELHRWNQQHAQPLQRLIQPHSNDRNPDRRLRIGYLSPDFRDHVVGQNLLPLFEHHDPTRHEIVCYAQVSQPDAITAKLREYADIWRNITGWSDERVANQIREDRIDILVDLALHTANNRLRLFARKPAPVQVTYLAYCGSSGMNAMDYRLSDPHLDPDGTDLSFYSEITLRLPRTYWCYQPRPTPPPTPSPALQNGFITFGCLNNFAKVSPAAIALWTDILLAAPNSRMILHSLPGAHLRDLTQRLERTGVDGDRVSFVGDQPFEQYVQTYSQIDIALDPFPFGGGITTLDALWMGVPVVTLSGETAVGRGGRSILSNLGLLELIAFTQEQYKQIAIDLTHDIHQLNALRLGMRDRMLSSPLLDGQGFARDVEAAYRQMWRKWCESDSSTTNSPGKNPIKRSPRTPPADKHSFDLAMQHLQARRFQKAEEIYRQILADQPQNAEAMHLLGIVTHKMGHYEAAAELIRSALALHPDFPEAHVNLGNVLKDQARLDDAIAAYRQAIALNPNLAGAYNNLGNALRDSSQLNEAIAAYRKAVLLAPDYALAHSSLCNAFRENGQLDEAVAAGQRAIVLRPNYAEAQYNLGNALREKGQIDQAIDAYRQAISLNPNLPEAQSNLGIALLGTGRIDEAIDAYRKAIAIRPNHHEAYGHLANALKEQRQFDEAIEAYRQALILKPDFVEAWYNLGNVFMEKWQADEAIAAYKRAISLDPKLAEAHNNLGNALKEKGQLDEAIVAYRQAIAFAANPSEVHSNLLLTLHYQPDMDPAAIAEEHRRWNQQHAEPLKKFIRPHGNNRDPERRLRIGYVSPDFHGHAVGYSLLPLFHNHNRRQFEVTCYANVARPDAITSDFQQHADRWRDIVRSSDQQAANQIREDQIDILVDLALHTAGNRLLIFAQKPAPVQITFAGYPGSTGLSAIDYRLSDPYLDPPAPALSSTLRLDSTELIEARPEGSLPNGMEESIYSEQTVRLPDSFWCYDPLDCRDIPVSPLPAQVSGVVTFGCLNHFCKINDRVLSVWAAVMLKVPGSRLLLLASQGSHRQHALDRFTQEGIDPQRIEFAPRQTRRDYMQLYSRIDIALDCFPYNGHTTSLDSFWMGVPVVTLVGNRAVSRAGWSQLSNLGLMELAADNLGQFVRIAVDLAKDLPKLQALRSTLRQRLEQSPLMDAPRFARNIEDAYRQAWRSWCQKSSDPIFRTQQDFSL